jgi:hypothetical protein
MANLVKSYVNHFGLDLKSSDITREPQFASDMQNAEYLKNGNISKRQGYRGAADSIGGFGLFNYVRIEPETAVETQNLLAVSNTIHKLVETSFVISYSGAEASVQIEIYLDKIADVYKCTIVEGTTQVFDYNMGVGIDDPAAEDLSDLKAAIEAISVDYSVTITGNDTIPMAYLDLVRDANLADGDLTIIARSYEEVNHPLADILPGNTANQLNDDWYLTTAAQLNNNIYFANGYDDLIKFDGQNAYRAGMPQPASSPGVALGVAGVLAPTNPYTYSYLYTQFDANGNEIAGIMSDDAAGITPVSQTVDVTLTNILAASGFNTNCAVVAGAQVSVTTITVDDGSGGTHTLKVGDTAYFFDSISGDYVEREVTGVTATDITIAGAAVTVADNDVISNNLRISIYRNQDGGTFKFLVAEVPNNSFTATQVYNDNTPDGSLGIQYVLPLTPHNIPPKGRYITSYNNQLFSAGNLINPNTVSWSAVEGPEYWEPDLFSLRIQSPNGDKITGLSQSNEVMSIFEKRAMHVISGDIPNNNLRVDTITKDLGCVSHNTIQEVRGDLYFLSDRGVWKTVSGQLPIQVSERIEPVFDKNPLLLDAQQPVIKRAIAINDRDKEQYVLFIPAETTNLVGITANSSSVLYVEDYYRNAWLKWTNMDFSGGVAIFDDKIHFTERRADGSSDVRHHLYARSNRGDNWDYQDNLEAIDWQYSTGWYYFNEPSVFKKFLRLKTYASQATANNSFILSNTIEKNFVPGLVAGTFTVDFSGSTDGYGVSPYGTTPYGDIFFPSRKCKIGPIKATAIRFVMENNNDCENTDILGWELEVALPYRTELKE